MMLVWFFFVELFGVRRELHGLTHSFPTRRSSDLVLKNERTVSYGIPGGLTWRMTVPGKDFSPRMAYVSCNGFSDPAVMRKLIRTSEDRKSTRLNSSH